MFTRRVRITFLIGVALVAFAAAIRLSVSEEAPTGDILAAVIIGLVALIEPLKTLWDWMGEERQKESEDELLRKLMGNVRRAWIDGILADALRDAQIDIAVAPTPERAGQSGRYADYQAATSSAQTGLWGYIKLRFRKGKETANALANTPDEVVQTFHATDEKLLILGAPGSGKSVLLLQLAERLLKEAGDRANPSAVPVIVNLSSWAVKRPPLEAWIIEELQRPVYGVSKDLARKWVINTGKLIYLLDGLDEVALAHRDECVTAINEFLNPERQVVICSRTAEYEKLANALNMHYAIEMQPMTAEEFKSHLAEYVPDKATVTDIMAMLQADDDVWEEVNKPLFLNVLATTYHDGTPFHKPDSAGTPIQQVGAAVIEPYITRQLQNAPADAPTSNTETRRYLSWLGYQMRVHNQTTFYVEMLQVDWLVHHKRTRRYGLVVGVFVGMIVGVFASQYGGLDFGLVTGLLVGSAVGQFVGKIERWSEINLQRKPAFGITRLSVGLLMAFRMGLRDGLRGWRRYALRYALIMGLFVGLFGMLTDGLAEGVVAGLVVGSLMALGTFLFLLIFLLYGGLAIGLSEVSPVDERNYPNQGLWDTLSSGLVVSLGGALVFGLVVWLSGEVSYLGVSWLFLGLFFGFIFGLSDVLKHIILRTMLRRQRDAPRRFDHFLYHARDRRLMRQVGSGFVFIHRYFLDYFADYYETHYRDSASS